jgi:WD40 repeat protein
MNVRQYMLAVSLFAGLLGSCRGETPTGRATAGTQDSPIAQQQPAASVTLPPPWTPTTEPTITPSATPTDFPVPTVRASPSPLPGLTPFAGMEGEAGDDHRIAFVSTRAGYRHIFTINENSFRLIQLTADFTYDSYPTWSLDGERLAFLRAQEEDSLGEGHLNLTQGLDRDIFSIVWSPDDRSIAFNAGMLGNDLAFPASNVYVVDIGTHSVQPIIQTHSSNVGCSKPTWSPDRTYLVSACRALMNSGLVLKSLDGTVSYSGDLPADGAFWMPSGETIVYTGGMAGLLSRVNASYLISKGESEDEWPSPLDDPLEAIGYEPMPVIAVTWSPTHDNRFILQSPDLMQIIDLETNKLIQVEADFAGVEGQVSWGPDDARVVYAYHDGNDYELAIVDLRTGESRKLTDNDVDDLMPAWQP